LKKDNVCNLPTFFFIAMISTNAPPTTETT